MSCPSSGPDGVIIGDTLYSTFMSSGSGAYRTYFSKSSISTGAANVSNLSGAITGLSQQNFPRIATDGNAMAIVWKQTVNGAAQLPVLFTNDIANGFPGVYDTVNLADITNADVAVSNGNLFVVWQDDASGTVKYRNGTYSQINTGINEIAENNFLIYPNPVSNQLNIQLTDNKDYSVSILNVLGEIMYSSPINIQHSQFSIHNFPNGIYFLQVKTNNKSFNSKIY